MNNPHNKLISAEKVESILNFYGNVGIDGQYYKVQCLAPFQKAFVHESYYMAVTAALKGESPDLHWKKHGDGEQTHCELPQKMYVNYVPEESSERLEFLGDHMLKAIVGRYLYERFPDEREGFLTKMKIKIEKSSMLHKFGLALGFREYLLLSLQVENQTVLGEDRGRNTPAYYENAFESFVGAVTLNDPRDGYAVAERFVRNVIENLIDFSDLITNNDNFKDSLQRFFQSIKWPTPVYKSINEEGPLYRRVFTRCLTITEAQFLELDEAQRRSLASYTEYALAKFRCSHPRVFEKLFTLLFDEHGEKRYLVGVGLGKKVVQAEQECSKAGLQNLRLKLDF